MAVTTHLAQKHTVTYIMACGDSSIYAHRMIHNTHGFTSTHNRTQVHIAIQIYSRRAVRMDALGKDLQAQ